MKQSKFLLLTTHYPLPSKKGLARRSLGEGGFTLIELIIVIGCVAIIMVAGAVSYTTFNKQGRDARRKQDLTTLRNALEVYKTASPGRCYPSSSSLSALVPTYINKEPKDPRTGGSYQYAPSGGACPTGYTVRAVLENGTSYTVNPYGKQ